MDETVAAVQNEEGGDLKTDVNDGSSVGTEQDSTNWKELFEREHTRAENYKTAFSQKREFVKKGVTDPVEEETEDNKPILRSELRKEIVEAITPIVAQNKVDAELEKQVSDPEKRKLVKLYYETRVRQMGTSDDAIRDGISDALAIADKQKLNKAAAEITRKTNMQTSPTLSGSSNEPEPVTKNHKFSKEQEASLTEKAKRLGMDPKKFIEQTWRNQSRG